MDASLPAFNLRIGQTLLRWLAAPLAVAAALCGGCAVAPPQAQRYVAPAIGSNWVLVRRDTGSYGSGETRVPNTRREAQWKGQPVVAIETPEATTLLQPDGGWLAQLRAGQPAVSWDPPLLWDWPLAVGRSWSRQYRMTLHPSGRNIDYQVQQRVEAYEDLSTPAGTFKVFRLSSTDTLGNQDALWFSPQLGIFLKVELRRTAAHAQGPGTRQAEVVSLNIAR